MLSEEGLGFKLQREARCKRGRWALLKQGAFSDPSGLGARVSAPYKDYRRPSQVLHTEHISRSSHTRDSLGDIDKTIYVHAKIRRYMYLGEGGGGGRLGGLVIAYPPPKQVLALFKSFFYRVCIIVMVWVMVWKIAAY